MKIYNSYTASLEEFTPIKNNEIKMYVCGPTIYSDIHIGNARPLIFFDVVSRFFKAQGYDVKYVSNITDIDDKIINKALELNITEEELVNLNLKEYKEICKTLNIDNFYAQPRVTQYIDKIVEYIQELVSNEYAYVVDQDVYFDTSKAKEYGKLSGIDLEQLKTGTRISENNKKKNPADFTLWKKTAVGITFDTPFGKGRPGWHTECVVMINEILGNQIDIHGGGVDLKFPHHENELAQHSCNHSSFANYWMHNGFIQLDDEKMSKSLGNTILVKDMLKKVDVNIIRLLMLQTNYRQPININDAFLDQTNNINNKLHNLFQLTKNYKRKNKTNEYINILNEKMSHDFSCANFITELISYEKKYKNDEIFEAILYGLDILGLQYSFETEDVIPLEVEKLIEKRSEYKKQKQFDLADKIREDILALGYDVFDTREGVTCKKIKTK